MGVLLNFKQFEESDSLTISRNTKCTTKKKDTAICEIYVYMNIEEEAEIQIYMVDMNVKVDTNAELCIYIPILPSTSYTSKEGIEARSHISL